MNEKDEPVSTVVTTGTQLAGYRLEAQVGQGPASVVFRARDQRLDRIVAVKVLTANATADPQFCARFMRDTRAIAIVDGG